MKFNVTAADLRRVFPGLSLPGEALVNHLNLDLGHLQLLRDCYLTWHGRLNYSRNDDFQNETPVQCDLFQQGDSPQSNDSLSSIDSSNLNDFWVMLLCLVSEVNDGSLCLDLTKSRYAKWFAHERMVSFLNKQSMADFALAGLQILAFDGERLYFKKYHVAEREVFASLQRLIKQNSSSAQKTESIKQVVAAVSDSVRFTLSEEQKLAMAVSLLQPFSIISGGPGTGKTTIMGSVLRCLVQLGLETSSMALAAPTGRAAYRMTESLRQGLNKDVIQEITLAEQGLLNLEATTLHRLLGANPSRKQHRYHAGNLLPYKLIVIDEVSMVDMMLMKQLLAAIPSGCRVILLGDQFQLPSVSSGAVLADLMPDVNQQLPISNKQKTQLHSILPEACHTLLETFEARESDDASLLLDCVTVLTDSKRCQADIAELSECVRKGDVAGFMNSTALHKESEENAEGFYWHNVSMDNKQWQGHYESWLVKHYFDQGGYKQLMDQVKGIDYKTPLDSHKATIDQVFTCIQSNRILTLVNQGEVGTQTINFHACEMMKHQLGVTGHEHLFHGAVIMVRRNDASLNLFNGDVGVLLEVETGPDQTALRAVFPNGSAYLSYSIHVIPEFTAAFAITVHKSQGSEFNHVLMPLPQDTDHRLLSREIIYTGMTRAKQSVQLVGSEAALQAGIRRKNIRHTGLRLWE